MLEVENDLYIINFKVNELFHGASLIKFSYSGIYTLEFDLPKDMYGFNFCVLDIGTEISVFNCVNENPFFKKFTIEDFLLVWATNVTKVIIEKDLSLVIHFDNHFCCNIKSTLCDPENLFDFRWSIYQRKEIASFYILVSNEQDIILTLP